MNFFFFNTHFMPYYFSCSFFHLFVFLFIWFLFLFIYLFFVFFSFFHVFVFVFFSLGILVNDCLSAHRLKFRWMMVCLHIGTTEAILCVNLFFQRQIHHRSHFMRTCFSSSRSATEAIICVNLFFHRQIRHKDTRVPKKYMKKVQR